jgi:4-diphosphocytidyl-2-C-methyl-D-erythritol kinase
MASVTIFAPAKINLFLHITGRRPDGYHLLESLVAFADIGDEISVADDPQWQLQIDGPFGKDLEPTQANSVAAAAHFFAKAANKEPKLRITLTKNLPIASGIGGGSSDAAATLLACQQLWQLPALPSTDDIVTALGADMPVCLQQRPIIMRGIGEDLTTVESLPACHVVLVNPGQSLPTAHVFKSLSGAFSSPLARLPIGGWNNLDSFVQFLHTTHNDLSPAAENIVPAIRNVLEALGAKPDCLLARMSGSGATCFGLFRTPDQAERAAANLAQAHPAWWVKAGHLHGDPVSVN